MKYLHTMVRVTDLDKSIAFFKQLGLKETRRIDNEKGRFTLAFMAAEGDEETDDSALLERSLRLEIERLERRIEALREELERIRERR